MTSKAVKPSKAATSSKAVKPSKAATPSKAVKPSKVATPSALQLLPGEVFRPTDDDEKKDATDEELNSRYVTGAFRIVTESARYSLAVILTMLDETTGPEKRLRYDLDPEYQRRHRWSRERKSRLIESFLMNIPVPPIFLYEREYAQFEVMDGRQRLTALAEFYRNEFALEGLQHWKELNGRRYKQLPSKVRDGIDRRYISSIILLKETAKDEEQAAQLKKLVFERLNSGGVALSPQEARNAVYRGPLSDLCLEMSNNAAFRKMWGIPEELRPDRGESGEIDDGLTRGEQMFQRMDDVEIVLRFFAYRHMSRLDMGLNNISMFLDRFLAVGNGYSDEVHREYRRIFEATTSLLWEILHEEAFCRIGTDKNARERPTKIVYDPLMWVASRYATGEKRTALLENSDVLRDRLVAMYEKHKDIFAGRRTNAKDVRERNQCMEEAFAEAIAMLRA
jgi:hypothetical protein